MALCAVRASATTVLPPDFPALVNGSDYIVHATVTAVGSEKQPSAHGIRIITRVKLKVIEIVAGTPPAEITLQLLGGRVGDEEVTVGGMPRFKVGDEDILFVAGNGRTICPLYGMTHGRYPIVTEPSSGRRYVARHDGTPLQHTAEIAIEAETAPPDTAQRHAMAMQALTPADFIRQIRAARGAATQPAQAK